MMNLRIALEHDHEFRGDELPAPMVVPEFDFPEVPLVTAMESARPYSRRHRNIATEGIALESFDPAWIIVGMALAAAALTKMLFWFLGDGNGSKGGGGGGFGRSEATIPQLRVKLERVDMGADIRKATKGTRFTVEGEPPEEKWPREVNRFDQEFLEGRGLGKTVIDQMEHTDWYLQSCEKLLSGAVRAREAWADQMESKALTEGQKRGLDATNDEFEMLIDGMARKWGAKSDTFNDKVNDLAYQVHTYRTYRITAEDAERLKSTFAKNSTQFLDKYEQSLPKYKADLEKIEASLKALQEDKTWDERRDAASAKEGKGLDSLPSTDTWGGIRRLEANFKAVMNTVRATLRVCHLSVDAVDRINHLATIRLNDDKEFIRYISKAPKDERGENVNELIAKYKD